jgi:hypothetical protein
MDMGGKRTTKETTLNIGCFLIEKSSVVFSTLRYWYLLAQGDVFSDRRSIQPLGGWMLSLLFGLVLFLTIEYAPGAFERTQMPLGTNTQAVISVESGFITIGVMAAIAIFVAFEPYLFRKLYYPGHSYRVEWALRKPSYVRYLVFGIWCLFSFSWKFPSILLSFLDFVLARPIAFLAGATQRGTKRRYLWTTVVLWAAVLAAVYAPYPFGLYAVGCGIVAVLATGSRRWNESWASICWFAPPARSS